MTTQDQIIAIAELDGLVCKPNKDWGFCICKDEIELTGSCSKPEWAWEEYAEKHKENLNSHDTIIPVIEKQTMTIKDTISGILYNIQTRGEHQFIATPSQLAEALLRATRRWKK